MAKIPPENIAIFTDISISSKDSKHFGIGIRIRDTDRDVLLLNQGTYFDMKTKYPDNNYSITSVNAELEGVLQGVGLTIMKYGQNRSLNIIIHTDIRQAKEYLKSYQGDDLFVRRYIRMMKRIKRKHEIQFDILSLKNNKFAYDDYFAVHNLARKECGLSPVTSKKRKHCLMTTSSQNSLN